MASRSPDSSVVPAGLPLGRRIRRSSDRGRQHLQRYLVRRARVADRLPGEACNSYQLWREDIDLVDALGLDTYRFSVGWARVEPAEGEFSAEALAYYRAVADYCVVSGIAPVLTYSHFTAPHWFALRGGWLDPVAPAAFARYCGVVTEVLGGTAAYAVTLNEPDLPRLLTWLDLPAALRDLDAMADGMARRGVRPVAGPGPPSAS